MKDFAGSMVAIITPMHEDGSLDFETLGSLIDWHIESGTDAICVAGTTGEASTLSFDEHRKVSSLRSIAWRSAARSWLVPARTLRTKPSS